MKERGGSWVLDERELRIAHHQRADSDTCAACGQRWPCEADRLLEKIDDLRQEIEYNLEPRDE